VLSSPRRLTILAGAGCLTLILVAVTVFRKEVVTQYHLLRLRSDPGYLHSILRKPEGTLQMSAVRRFLETPEGRAALLRHLVKHVNEAEWRGMASRKTVTFVLEIPQSLPHLWPGSGHTPILCEDSKFFEDSSRVYEVGRMPDDATLSEMLGYLVGRHASLPEYPEVTFLCHDLDSWQQYLRARRNQEHIDLPVPGAQDRRLQDSK
jgi:hypothetical protein